MVTLGTGIGTALFIDGHLVPNTELGHLTLRGRDAETWAVGSRLSVRGTAMAGARNVLYPPIMPLFPDCPAPAVSPPPGARREPCPA
ncbi:MAG: hypothetical protein A3I63_10850 [Betaproteobacteria bacterium RIFCSPLOWO2_02_FULL_66_14]|nr:MAG: hypothetical protein A3I63_10850 [Betaproteobacteria bacterium RIFCSPLOWO2_02_FULL_66_14]